MRRRRTRRVRAGALLVAGAALVALGVVLLLQDDESPPSSAGGGTLTRPIDPRQQTAMAFGQRSHWLQPWRGYLDTPPATRLRDAIGINFNVEPGEAQATARLLARSGFKRARIEVSWDQFDYDDPTKLKDPGRFETMLGALRRQRIRPLILLNSNHNAPTPIEPFTLRLAQPAAKGARRIRLAPGSTDQVEPGRSGPYRSDAKAADPLITAVADDGTATLSRPLPSALAAGDHKAVTLRYEPFGPPTLTGGRPNPRFERTLQGWTDYTTTIVRRARDVLGSQDFDVEIWNEQTFGADFLRQETYYDPPRESGEGEVTQAILKRTVEVLRKESPKIGIGDGFASQTPFPAGSTSPRGLTAIDKHPYYGIKRFPKMALINSIAPLDAFGRPSYTEKPGRDGETIRRDRFIPSYDAFFPEYILSGIQTETMIRDLSPISTEVNGTLHGRKTHPPGGKPPQVWVTEANLDPTGADPTDPSKPGSGPIDTLKPPDVRRLQAKAALRYYTAFVNKGVTAVNLFAVKGGESLSLVDPGFFEKLGDSPETYPGDHAGGAMPAVVRRLSQALEGAGPVGTPQPLTLDQVSEDHGQIQFEGDGTRGHPPLRNRDVLAFFPFQLGSGRWVAAVYVMTRNMAKPYGEGDDPERFDLPQQPYRLTIGGLEGSGAEVRATDPLTGSDSGAKVISRERRAVTIEVQATDSPRLVFLNQR